MTRGTTELSREQLQDLLDKHRARLSAAGAVGEPAGNQAHDEGTGDIFDHGGIRKRHPEPARVGDIDAVTERCADSAAKEDDQISHDVSSSQKC